MDGGWELTPAPLHFSLLITIICFGRTASDCTAKPRLCPHRAREHWLCPHPQVGLQGNENSPLCHYPPSCLSCRRLATFKVFPLPDVAFTYLTIPPLVSKDKCQDLVYTCPAPRRPDSPGMVLCKAAYHSCSGKQEALSGCGFSEGVLALI